MGVLIRILSFCVLFSISLAKECVPVLLWGNEAPYNSYLSVPALKRYDTEEFADFLSQKVKVGKPCFLVILEENLSIEDFSWKDSNDNGAFPLLSNLTKTAADMLFLPSVHNPSRAIKNLKGPDYVIRAYEEDVFSTIPADKIAIIIVKLDEPKYSEDRPDMLRNHDEQIKEVYNEALTYRSNVLAIYSGRHSSWIDSHIDYNRVKRDAETPEETEKTVITVNIPNLTEKILLSADSIDYSNGSVELKNLKPTTGTAQTGDNWMVLDINTKELINIDLNFTTSSSSHAWSLSNVYLNEKKDDLLNIPMTIAAPSGYSYHCSQEVVFSKTIGERTESLTFKNLQLQVFANDDFGPVIDCIEFFTTAIWSGIFIVFILALVLAWGIVMIMDINTMDRFDDPKGKTITISSTE